MKGHGNKKVWTVVLIIAMLLVQSVLFEIKYVEATGCSVSIVNVNPPSGTVIEDNSLSLTTGTISVNITVSWSVNVPIENITGTGFLVLLDKAFWNETRNNWQFLAATTLAFGKSDIPNSPKTVQLGLDPKKMWLLNASVICEYIKNQTSPVALPDLEYYSDYDEKTLNYQLKSDMYLEASFTMNPENPTINDNVEFFSTSTSSNSSIVEHRWYLDGQYLQDVGNNESWSSKLTKGTHTVELTVIDNFNYSDTASKTFNIKDTAANQLILTASTDKTTYITHEKIIITGKLVYDGTTVMGADINLKIHQADGTIKTWPGPLTSAVGSYEVKYEIPKTPPNALHPVPETWTIEINADPVETEYGTTSATVTIQVVPVFLQLHSIHLVQVVEVPVIDGKTYLAAGREAGLRLLVSCPTLKGFTNIAHPEVIVDLDIGSGITTVKNEQQTASIGPDPTPIDFKFSLNSGTYLIYAQVDPYCDFTETANMQTLAQSQTVIVKDMKTLKIEYVPLYLQLDSENKILNFDNYCKEQSNFIKDVYPLPNSNMQFYEVTETIDPVLLSPTLHLIEGADLGKRRWLLLKALSLRSYLTADKVVGVLPNDSYWWESDNSGMAGWSFVFIYYTRSVLVKYGAQEGVTAHEIGHTLGLNRYAVNEEYNTNPPHGRQVTGLIMKEGNIFNITNDNEKAQTFGEGNTGNVYCFMGSNPGDLTPTWVCSKTYSELFKALMDPPQKIVYVSGTIYKNDTVLLDNWYLGEGEPDLVDEGTYTMQCVSSSGEVLYNTSFGGEVEDFLGFGFVIPYPDGTDSIQIKKGEKTLREVQATTNAPTVEIQFPNGGEDVEGTKVISWSGTDDDEDQLLYSVLCSADGGETWSALALELNETSCSLDFSAFPNGNQYKIKVVATDGFNTGQDVSDNTFSVNFSSMGEDSEGTAATFPIYLVVVVCVIALVVVLSIFAVYTFRRRHKNPIPNPPMTK